MTLKDMRGVQLLVRLSSNSVSQSIVLFLIRRQLVLVGLVFIITFAFSRNSKQLAAFIQIPDQVAMKFFSATSQALAALLGLLIIFLTFRTQTINEQKSSYYRRLQTQIERLISLSLERPNELQVFDDNLAQVIDSFTSLASLRMKYFPIWASQYDLPSFNKLVSGFISKCQDLKDKIPRVARLHLQQTILFLDNIAKIIEAFSELYTNILLISYTVIAITKLSFLMGASLVLLLLFGVVDLQKVFPDLGLPTIITLMVWLLIVLLEQHSDRSQVPA